MIGAYKKTAQVGIFKAVLRYIEDPNRNIITRIFLAATPLFIVYVLSPLDLIPEVLLGPIGLTDDILIIAGLIFLLKLANSFYSNKKYHPNNKTNDNIIDI
jgi:uncharacterized membrane protein YkvA (DUF1232 family)